MNEARNELFYGIMPAATFWTADRRDRLRSLIRDGRLTISLAAAAAALGCELSTVRAELRRQHLLPRQFHSPRGFWTPARRTELDHLCSDGRLTLTADAAAAGLGCTVNVLMAELRRRGLRTLHARAFTFTRAMDRELLRLRGGDGVLSVSIAAAARRLRAPARSVRRALRRLGCHVDRAPPFWTAEKCASLDALRRPDGSLAVTVKEAARRLGCHHLTITRRLKGRRPGR